MTILAFGTYADLSEAGPAAFTVLRHAERGVYKMAPLGSSDAYWADHLGKLPQVKARILRTGKEKVEDDVELVRRWRVIGRPGEQLDKKDLDFLGIKPAEKALKTWRFLQEEVVSDMPPQDG